MNGKFITSADAERDQLDWGVMGWMSRPSTTNAKDLVVIEVDLQPGFGHAFHKHPNQEEVIYVVEGTVEQWIEKESRQLNPGDSAFIAADVVHASYNISADPVKLVAILGPCVTDEGYELVEVFDQEPWASLK